jgi:4-amino-4-deoxy-L-arabinose transferase-like glycosyltransferase
MIGPWVRAAAAAAVALRFHPAKEEFIMASGGDSKAYPGPAVPLTRAVIWLAGVKFLAHVTTARHYPLHRDELYYIVCGRHPAWGYPDHPPLTPWLARLSEQLFGLDPLGLRLWPALAGAAVVLLTGWLAARWGGGRPAQVLAAAAVLLAPIYLVSGSLLQTVVLDQLCWVGSAALLAGVQGGGPRWRLLLVGLLLGVGIWAKLTALAWCFGLLAGVLTTRDRSLLRSRWSWAGVLAATACAVPIVLWQVRHGWPVLEFMAGSRANEGVTPWAFLLLQIGMSGPVVGTALLVTGFVFLLRDEAGRPWRSLGVAILVVWLVFLFTGGKPYYAGPTYPLLMAGGAVLAERLLARGRTRFKRIGITALVVLQLAAVPFFLPVIPPGRLGAVVDKLPNDDWVNMFGWQEVAAQLAAVHATLTPAEQEGLRVLAPNYGIAGAVDVYGGDLGLPQAVSGHNGYALWETSPDLDPLLAVGYDATLAREYYAEVRELGTVAGTPLGPGDEAGQPILYCRGLRVPPDRLWTLLRHFE